LVVPLRSGVLVESAAGTCAVTIPATLAAMLDEHLATYVKPQPDALVFTSDEGLPMHRGRWAFVWRRAAKAAGHVSGGPITGNQGGPTRLAKPALK
jgi:hypothetical protein